MYSKTILQGNLTQDIEIKYLPSGSAVGRTSIAVNHKYKNAAGEQKEEVMYMTLDLFGRTAEIANQYLRKGSKVLVDGRLKLNQWTAQDGSKRSMHSLKVETLQMLDGKDNQTQPAGASVPVETYGADGSHQGTSQYRQPAAAPTSNIPEIDISEDEIPF